MVASKPTGGFLKWTHFAWSNPVICNTLFAFILEDKRLKSCSHLLWQDIQMIRKSQQSCAALQQGRLWSTNNRKDAVKIQSKSV